MSRDVIMTSSGTCQRILIHIFFSPSSFRICFHLVPTDQVSCLYILGSVFFQKCHVTSSWVIRYLLVHAYSTYSFHLVPTDQVSCLQHFGKCVFQKCHVTSPWRHQVPAGACSFQYSFHLVLTDQVSCFQEFGEVSFSEMSRDVIMTSSGTCWRLAHSQFSFHLVPTDQVSCL